MAALYTRFASGWLLGLGLLLLAQSLWAGPDLSVHTPLQLPLRPGAPYPVRAILNTAEDVVGYLELRFEYGSSPVVRQPLDVGPGRYEFWLLGQVPDHGPARYTLRLCHPDGSDWGAAQKGTAVGKPSKEHVLSVLSVGGLRNSLTSDSFAVIAKAGQDAGRILEWRQTADTAVIEAVGKIRGILAKADSEYATKEDYRLLIEWLTLIEKPGSTAPIPSEYTFIYNIPSSIRGEVRAELVALSRHCLMRATTGPAGWPDTVQGVSFTTLPSPGSVPPLLGSYDGVDVIVWHAGVRAELTREQEDTLADYLRRGGRLVLALLPGETHLYSPVPDVLGDQGLNDPGAGVEAPQLLDGWWLEPTGAWYEAQVGFGRLVVMAEPIAGVATWDREAQLALLGRSDPRLTYASWQTRATHNQDAAMESVVSLFDRQFKEDLVRNSQNSGPPLLKLAGSMGVYFVLIVMCIVGTRVLGRPLLLWVALPTLAIVFAVGAVPMFRYHSAPDAEAPLVITDVAPDERTVKRREWRSMRNPAGKTYSTTIPSHQQALRWTTMMDTQYAPESQEHPPILWQEPGQRRLQMDSYLGAYHFLATTEIDEDTALDAATIPTLRISKNRLYVERDGTLLANTMVFYGNRMASNSQPMTLAAPESEAENDWFVSVGGNWYDQGFDQQNGYIYAFGASRHYGARPDESSWWLGCTAITAVAANAPWRLNDTTPGNDAVQQHLAGGGVIVVEQIDARHVTRYFLPAP